jgi:myo-inositol 2-dehydrogenase/D-chiro-inositol 1-dehydrogenase
MTAPYKAVQIGAGSFARSYHAPTLQRLAEGANPRLILSGICDLELRRAEEFCRDFGYRQAYDDFLRMIEVERPDLIYCMVQPEYTAGIVEQLLPLRIPLFIEKPPGVTMAQAERMAELAGKYGVINSLAFNRRCMPGIQRMKQWAAKNGPIRYARAEMLRNRRLEAEFGIGTAIHPLDCLRFLCGEVKNIVTHCSPYPRSPARDFLVRITFESGTVADLTVLVDCGVAREQYTLQLENQMMEVSLGTAYACSFCHSGERIYRDNQLQGDDPASADPLIAGGFLGEHEAFLAAVAEGKTPPSCLEDGRHSLKLAMAIHQVYCGSMDLFEPGARGAG